MDFRQRYNEYALLVDKYLDGFIRENVPKTLYEPARYILASRGKRIRPLLVLCTCESVGGRKEDALDAAAGIEILHNFTLVHDDIMDNAKARRGRSTVHTKWDHNVAILAGDVLLGLAYRALFRSASARIQEIGKIFTEGVIEVCEGQAYDKEFEYRKRVSLDDYLLMVRKKTGAMVAAATEIGALLGNSSNEERSALKTYGEIVGRAFQIQDDLLDVIADEEKFGKAIGGDIVEGKKTFLLLTALARATGSDRRLLRQVVDGGLSGKNNVAKVRKVYYQTGAIAAAEEQIGRDIQEAKKQIRVLKDSDSARMLLWFADMLLNRKS
jgi:geranylgeranyl diphosphate synthase type II